MRLRSLLVLGLPSCRTTLVAQRRQRAPDALPNTPYDGNFTFVRIRYDPGGMSGDGGSATAIPAGITTIPGRSGTSSRS